MPPKPAWVQLVDLCEGGATPERIEAVAPFLQGLPATHDAISTMHQGTKDDWPIAARQLLLCVTQPGGAAMYDEQISWFVQICFDLNSSGLSLAKRFRVIIDSEKFHFHKDERTHKRNLAKRMNSLAATLLTLPTYPCAPKPDREAAVELEADLFAISVIRRFGIDEENKGELRELVQDIFRRVESAWLLFENVAPQLSSVRRLQMTVGALATGLYSRTYAELVQRGDTDLVSPRSLRTMFDFDAESPHGFDEGVEGSFRIVAELMVAIEQADAWPNVLFRREEAGSRTLDEGQ